MFKDVFNKQHYATSKCQQSKVRVKVTVSYLYIWKYFNENHCQG